MLTHHSGQDYKEAASEAAGRFRVKMEQEIEAGKRGVATVLEVVQRDVPTDLIARSDKMQFTGAGDRLLMEIADKTTETRRAFSLHEHAQRQIASKFEIPKPYMDTLLGKGDWGRRLLAHNLNDFAYHEPRRLLVRAVRDEVRGVLSDSCRRLNTAPLLDAFARAAERIGAVPVSGKALDTKISVKALLPRVFEPVPGEVVAFGLSFENSEFGDGALSLRVFYRRLWCTNDAITEEAMRQVHLGGRLADDVAFSERTYRLDTSRSASVIDDIVSTELAPAKITKFCDGITIANETKVTPGQMKEFLAKHLLKGEAANVVEAFNSPDVEMLPAGQNAWRFSNAISWIAGKTEDAHRALELQKIAALALPSQS